MKKQWILLLVLAIALTSAPAAMADHCYRCSPAALACVQATNFGWEYCEWTWDNNCIRHTPCGDHGGDLAALPLAAEFTVASVERLDEPQADASETRVASLATPAPVTQR